MYVVSYNKQVNDSEDPYQISPVTTKPVFRFSNHIRHKPGCTATEDGKGLVIKEVEGLHYLRSENKGPDQLRCDRAVDLRLYFSYICEKQVSNDAAHVTALVNWLCKPNLPKMSHDARKPVFVVSNQV